MATLSDPVRKQNIVDRFADFVPADANGSIVWANNNVPFGEAPADWWGGSTSGKAIGIVGGSITGTTITASTIRSVLLAETQLYTNIRNLRAILFVDGGGGNTGSRPTPGVVFDQTQVSYLDTGARQSLGAVADSGVVTDSLVSASNLEGYFTNLRTEYRAKRGVTVDRQVNVCHASCHSSCHGSRGRR